MVLTFDVPSKWYAMSKRAAEKNFHGLKYYLECKYPMYVRHEIQIKYPFNQSAGYKILPQEGNEYISIPADCIRYCVKNYLGKYVDHEYHVGVYEKGLHNKIKEDARKKRTQEYKAFQKLLQNPDAYSKAERKAIVEAAIAIVGKEWVAFQIAQVI
jgi:hypothetical protein